MQDAIGPPFLGQHRSFRHSGGSRGITNIQQVIPLQLGPDGLALCLCKQLLIIERETMILSITNQRNTERSDFVKMFFYEMFALRLHEQIFGIAVFEYMQYFRPDIYNVDANPSGTNLHAGKEVLINLYGFQRENADSFPLFATKLLQCHSKTIRTFMHFAPSGAALSGDVSRFGRIILCTTHNHVSWQHIEMSPQIII
jgi:hypothetical protein